MDRMFAMDVEATSLDTRLAKAVGVSLCIEPTTALYAPTGHRIGNNLDFTEVVDEVAVKVASGYMPAYYNSKYDLNVTQANSKKRWEPGRGNHIDVLELVYLENPDRQGKDLKTVALEDLGYEMTRFEELFTLEEIKSKVLNIATKNPNRVLDYATDDAIATRLLLNQKKKVLEEFEFAVKVDTRVVDVVRRMEHNGGMVINEEYIHTQMDLLEKRAKALADQVYRVVGYPFEIGSPKALGIALFEKLGIQHMGKTKTGQYKTDGETMDLLAQANPIVEYVISYRKVSKARGTYFEKLDRLAKTKKPVRFSFHIYAAPTFRFAAPGGDPDKDGMTGVNIQAVSNGEERDLPAASLSIEKAEDNYFQGMDKEDLLVDLKEEGIVGQPIEMDFATLPWVLPDLEGKLFCIRESCDSKACSGDCKRKGLDITRRLTKNLRMIPSVRHAFMAPEGYTLCSFDYDRQELVIGANLSGEPNWIVPLQNKEDLHEKSTLNAFGLSKEVWDKMSEEEKKTKRDIGKIINFAVFYGATAYTIARKANLPQAQGEMIFDGYKKANPTLFSWITKVHMFSRKNKYTTTYFGRKRQLGQFYDEATRLIEAGQKKAGYAMQAFADRSAVNTCIQGTGAECTRIAMVKVDSMFQKEGITRKEACFVQQLHDELSFLIRDELVRDIGARVIPCMAFTVKSWPVQLSCTMKAGKVWGLQKGCEVGKLAA